VIPGSESCGTRENILLVHDSGSRSAALEELIAYFRFTINSVFDATRTALKISHLAVLLLLRVYSLPAGSCLPRLCLGTAISSDSTIPAFRL
jgi:hypothetical protein